MAGAAKERFGWLAFFVSMFLPGAGHAMRSRPLRASACSGEVCEGASAFEEELGNRHSIAIDPSLHGDDFKGRVPEGKVFVLGDNRSNSHDSRHHGPIRTDSVIGKVTRLWLRADGPRWEPVR